jgi:hypothetical protein
MAYTKQEIAVYEKIRMRTLTSQCATWLIVGVVLVALKLGGALHLGWWWTTAPFSLIAINLLATCAHIGSLRSANTREQQQR